MCSSMFLDEDEDLAHEFYEECRVLDRPECLEAVVRWTMRRIKKNIRPQVLCVHVYVVCAIYVWRQVVRSLQLCTN